MSTRDTLAYYARLPILWTRQTVHNAVGIVNVASILWLRPMRPGLLDAGHPFCTGIEPTTNASIWPQNVVFRTARRDLPANGKKPAESDDAILERVGGFMCAMVARTVVSAEHPAGQPSRMPPAVNYLHGGVHYNGSWLIFNDFAEAIEHFTDERFRAELVRFVREQRREPVVVFRQRGYDRRAFAEFVCFLRSVLPFFSNSNGPRGRVLWGNPSPYAAVNIITGNWIRDVHLLATPAGRRQAPRPPVPRGVYFRDAPYRGWRARTKLPERLLAILTERRIRMRGERGNLFFVDARKLRDRPPAHAGGARSAAAHTPWQPERAT